MAKPQPSPTLPDLTAKDLANVFGCSVVSIGRLTTKRVISRKPNGRFDLVMAVRAYIEWRERTVKKVAPAVTDPRSRWIAAKAEMTELALQERRGSLVSAHQIEAAFREVAERTRSRLLAIPARVATRLINISNAARVQAVIANDIEEALTSLANTGLAEIEAEDFNDD